MTTPKTETPDTRGAVERPKINELMALIERFGSAMFDCGEYAEPSDSEGYEALCENTARLRVKMRATLTALLEERDTLKASFSPNGALARENDDLRARCADLEAKLKSEGM